MARPADPVSPEGAVRLYLMYLEDPQSLRNDAEISRLEEDAARAKDPIDRARALAALHRARNVDGETYRADFVRHAKTWADDNDIPAAVLSEMGVPDEDLAEAGLVARPTPPMRVIRLPRAGPPKTRAKQVRLETIVDFVLGLTGTFVLSDIQKDVGGSPMTVRKAVEELVRRGEVERLGPQENWSGKGRAPNVYRRI
jgi:hypothetical protein